MATDLKNLLRDTRTRFENAAIDRVDAELILAHVLGIERMQLHAQTFQLNSEQEELFEELVNSRISGVPTQYLIGEAPFRYLTFSVGPGVLIPRPETELLVDAAMVEIERLKSSFNATTSAVSVVDLGAGSGAISISIAHEARQRSLPVQVVAVEKSDAALEWLKKNIARHDVDVRVIHSDVRDALIDVKCDIVVANPPYVPNDSFLPPLVLENEPHEALFSGPGEGLEVPQRFIEAATRLLKPGGALILEHFEDQSAALEQLLSQDYSDISQYKDLNQRPRWLTARRKER
ncbi:MAG: peptide chain release factor N(5)-glutamine methyltransferase [Actinobacteria bacterium]|jgi:release factor glutamine methyltransferase|nr:peptide chain release factor N(5)-glutamine methyltransferase [Actinomycetota bacterium]